ncbi:MAG TPA: GNAT family N-acetyltransferase, partial [Anaerolineaceae bacterium]|nr:GNAT family N-acetyltransferase [Anaerolineaceae bacterium]
MSNFRIKNFQADDIPALMQVQQEYAKHYPGVMVLPGELYLSPAFHQGQDVFCAYHPNGQMLGFSVVYAQLSEDLQNQFHTIWAEVKVIPSMNPVQILRDTLLDQVYKRVKDLTSSHDSIPSKVIFQYFPYEAESIAFVKNKGFNYSTSVYSMQRDLGEFLPPILLKPEFLLKPWRLESQTEIEQYVQARNLCFPDVPISLEEWIYFMGSNAWATGTNFAVFQNEELVGCLTAYWDEEQNRDQKQKIGYTEYIFVCPPWRRRGIATALITTALQYLKDHGIDFAQLQVK